MLTRRWVCPTADTAYQMGQRYRAQLETRACKVFSDKSALAHAFLQSWSPCGPTQFFRQHEVRRGRTLSRHAVTPKQALIRKNAKCALVNCQLAVFVDSRKGIPKCILARHLELGAIVHNSYSRQLDPGSLRIADEERDGFSRLLDKIRQAYDKHKANTDWKGSLQGIQDKFGEVLIIDGRTRAGRIHQLNIKYEKDLLLLGHSRRLVEVEVIVDVTADFRSFAKISSLPYVLP